MGYTMLLQASGQGFKSGCSRDRALLSLHQSCKSAQGIDNGLMGAALEKAVQLGILVHHVRHKPLH